MVLMLLLAELLVFVPLAFSLPKGASMPVLVLLQAVFPLPSLPIFIFPFATVFANPTHFFVRLRSFIPSNQFEGIFYSNAILFLGTIKNYRQLELIQNEVPIGEIQRGARSVVKAPRKTSFAQLIRLAKRRKMGNMYAVCLLRSPLKKSCQSALPLIGQISARSRTIVNKREWRCLLQ